jgi:hypothetical protein
MKNFFKLILLLAVLCIPAVTYADESAMIQNKALSAQYKSQITILGHEMKALKAKIKANPTDTNLRVELETKKGELDSIKEKKKIVDDAIKADKASQKAAKAAEKARQKAEKAAEKASKLHHPAVPAN